MSKGQTGKHQMPVLSISTIFSLHAMIRIKPSGFNMVVS